MSRRNTLSLIQSTFLHTKEKGEKLFLIFLTYFTAKAAINFYCSESRPQW